MSCNCQNNQVSDTQFVCRCDRFVHPEALNIGAGLSDLPRQIAGFPEFRRAMLFAIRRQSTLDFWRAREGDDLGLMLLEMWAYVCDVTSFYDSVIAQEAYIRTARRRPSLRRLVALLGYLPRPAVAAAVELAALADGRLPITLPAGTAFRSNNPSQVFELEKDTDIHPLANRWMIKPPHPGVILTDDPSYLLIQARANHQPNDLLLLIDTENDLQTQPLRVKKAEPYQGKDGRRYTKIIFQGATKLTAGTPLGRLRLMMPSQSAGLWTSSGASANLAFRASRQASAELLVSEEKAVSIHPNTGLQDVEAKAAGKAGSAPSGNVLTLDNSYKEISAGDYVLIEKSRREARWYKIEEVRDQARQIGPAIFLTTQITLDVPIDHEKRRSPALGSWTAKDDTKLRVHYGMRSAGEILGEAKTTLAPTDLLAFHGEIEKPVDGHNPKRFFFTDKNTRGYVLNASVDFENATLNLAPNEGWSPELLLPVEVLGNPIRASRGESVRNETLGSGNAMLANQTFKLGKKPLTYLLAPAAGNDDGIQSTLRVFVNGIRWEEARSFYGKQQEDQVFIVRQNDEGDSFVTFGDGIRGRRLPSGVDNVVASYRFGAGRESPPAGALTQIDTPVPGLGSIRNPVAATGGADAEGPEDLRAHAPRSALILGRAVSMQDMEAVTLSIPGVRAVQSEWRWHGRKQRAVANIWYIGEAGIEDKIMKRLRSVSDPSTPILAEQAEAVPIRLDLDVGIDARYIEQNVLLAIREALANLDNGLLAPENVGIGKPLFRSRIFEAVLSIEGTIGVQAIFWNQLPFNTFAKTPGAGRYFDFEQGGLQINGTD